MLVSAQTPSSVAEVCNAISRLKSDRVAGLNGITPDLLKGTNEPITTCLHSFFHRILLSGRVLADLRDGVIIPLYKGKAPKLIASATVDLTVAEAISKLLSVYCRLQQFGFTPSRSSVDAILASELLVELHREFLRPLHVAYVNLKSAFDSVNRSALWLALETLGLNVF